MGSRIGKWIIPPREMFSNGVPLSSPELKADFDLQYQKVLENEAQARRDWPPSRSKLRTSHQREAERRRKQARKLRWYLAREAEPNRYGILNLACPSCPTCCETHYHIGHHAGRLFAMREAQYDRGPYFVPYRGGAFDLDKERHKYHPSQLMRKWTRKIVFRKGESVKLVREDGTELTATWAQDVPAPLQYRYDDINGLVRIK